MSLTLRLRTAKGIVPFSVPTNATFYQLLEKVADVLPEPKLPVNCINIKGGYPVQDIYGDRDARIETLGLQNGDILIATSKPPDAALLPKPKEVEKPAIQTPAPTNGEGTVIRRVVPADNSCLFTSIAYVFKSETDLRELIAQEILKHPEIYDETLLDENPVTYSTWILQKDHWGGAIEIAVLAKYFQSEIAVCDIQSGRIDVFGQEDKYVQRAYLLYDGIHYDPLAFTFDPSLPESCDVTLFLPSDEFVRNQAIALSSKSKQQRQFTDIGGFTLRCGVCNVGLVGVKEAEAHCAATGHTNFAEYAA